MLRLSNTLILRWVLWTLNIVVCAAACSAIVPSASKGEFDGADKHDGGVPNEEENDGGVPNEEENDGGVPNEEEIEDDEQHVGGSRSGLRAEVPGCDGLLVWDSGFVVQVVVERECELSEGPVEFYLVLPNDDVIDVVVERGRSVAVEVPGHGARRVGLHRRGDWVSFANESNWLPRDGAGLLALDGTLYLLGGWLHGPTCSEVWRTTDLATWEFLGDAPWPARHGAGWLVHDGRLWVIGGDLLDDVWSSSDGVVWVEEAIGAPFGRRYTPNAAVLNGEIVVYAGQGWAPEDWCHARPDCSAVGFRDVWASPDGQNWRLLTPEAPWEARALVHGSVVVDGELHLIGGGLKAAPPDARYMETVIEYSDVWTTADGVTWVEREAAVPSRTHFSVVATPMGCFLSDGSVETQANVSSELFHGADCRHFEPVPDELPLQPRHASSLVWWNGSIVILGGPPAGGAGTTVWQYFP